MGDDKNNCVLEVIGYVFPELKKTKIFPLKFYFQKCLKGGIKIVENGDSRWSEVIGETYAGLIINRTIDLLRLELSHLFSSSISNFITFLMIHLYNNFICS